MADIDEYVIERRTHGSQKSFNYVDYCYEEKDAVKVAKILSSNHPGLHYRVVIWDDTENDHRVIWDGGAGKGEL